MKYPLPAIVGPYVRLNGVDSNSSELRGSEHLTAGGEGFKRRARQVPKREARVILLSLPA